MNAALAVTLKQDWDYQPRLGDPRGHHASRLEELAAVADFVERRDEGSLLVVGRRGSGKTSLVFAAVNQAADRKPQGKTIVPVLVRATSIESDGPIDKKELLVSLIRSLRRRVSANRRARSLQKQVDELHENATATKKSRTKRASKTATWSLRCSMVPPSALALLLLLFGSQWLGDHWLAAAIAIMAPAPLLAAGLGARSRLAVSSRHDYGLADMQQEFEEALQDHAAAHKVVFILDEFDKAGDGQSAPSIMAPLKMLINQGGALYIFITSPDKIGNIESRSSSDYTVFSELLYVKRSLFEEMERFIDDIVDTRSVDLTDDHYADLQCYLCYKARADFFDLYRAIRDQRMRTSDCGRPVIRAELTDKEKTASNLQRAIKYVYDRKSYGMLSRQQDNDDMLEIMYDLSEKSETMLGQTITISGHKICVGDTTVEYAPHEASAARDLFMLLSDEGYLENNGDEFTVKGTLSLFKGGMHVEEERAFADAYARMLDAMVDIANCKCRMDGHAERFDRNAAEDQWGDLQGVVAAVASVSIPDEMRQCRLQIGLSDRPSATPDMLRACTNQARQAVIEMRTSSVELVARMFQRYLGLNPSLELVSPSGFDPTANLGDQGVRSMFADMPCGDRQIRIHIVDAQKTEVSESIRVAIDNIKSAANAVVILLVGDNAAPGLDKSFFVVDSVDSADQLVPGTMIRARDHRAYGFAVKSPPTVRQLGLVMEAIKRIKDRLLSGCVGNFELEWTNLQSVAKGTMRVTDSWFENKWGDPGAPATHGSAL